MDNTIKALCDALHEEIENVVNYTNKIKNVTDMEVLKTFAANRMDAAEHIPSLAIKLGETIIDNPLSDIKMGGDDIGQP